MTYHISPDGYWRWDGRQWVPNVRPPTQVLDQHARPGHREWTAGVVGAAVLAPVIFPDTGIGDVLGFGG